MTEYRYALHGEVDLANAQQLRLDLRHAVNTDSAHLLVDCTHLTFLDSTGIVVLLEANRLLEVDGRHMLILNVQPGPRRVFEALGLTDLLRWERDSV